MKSKNLMLLGAVYDNTAQRLHNMAQSGKPFTDASFRDHLAYLELISRTLMAVYQIEKVRAQNDGMMPEEKVVPDSIKPKHPPNQPPQPGLSNFPSPGGWTP